MRFLPIALVLVAIGCSHGTARMNGNTRPEKPKTAPIEVFITKTPTRAYEEIGIFKIQGDEDMDGLIRLSERRARELGGDAVILRTNAGGYTEGSFWRSSSGGTLSEGIVIAWTTP